MDELVQDAPPVEEVPQVVEVVDARSALEEVQRGYDERLSSIDEGIEGLRLQVQAESGTSGTVVVDDTQWQTLVDQLSVVSDSVSVSLFLSLICVCVVSAILGTRLFAVFAEGWRH